MSNGNGNDKRVHDKSAIRLVAETVHGDIGGRVIEKLYTLRRGHDPEGSHIKADALMCQLLRDLGFDDVVDDYEQLDRWYS